MSKFNEAKKYINGYVIVTVVVSILVLFAAGGLYTYDYVEKNRNEVELTWDKSRIDFVNRLSNVVMHKNLINVVVPDTNKSGLPKEVGTRTYSGFTRISKDEISYTLKDGRTIIFDVNETAFDREYKSMITKFHYKDNENKSEYAFATYFRYHTGKSGDIEIGFANSKSQFDKFVPTPNRKSGYKVMKGTNVYYLDPRKEENAVFVEYLCRAMIDDNNTGNMDQDIMHENLRSIGKNYR
jgi:hypothetical protein